MINRRETLKAVAALAVGGPAFVAKASALPSTKECARFVYCGMPMVANVRGLWRVDDDGRERITRIDGISIDLGPAPATRLKRCSAPP